MMVNRESATKLSRSSNTVPFTGNHSSIVKFPHKSDEQYKIVVYRLDEGVSRAKEMSEVDVATKLG